MDADSQLSPKKAPDPALLAGSLFLASALLQIVNLFYSASQFWHFGGFLQIFASQLFSLLALLLPAAALFLRRRDHLTVAAFSLYALAALLSLFRSGWYLPFILITLLSLAAALGILAILLVTCTDRFPRQQDLVRSCWFIPAVLTALVLLFQLLGHIFYWGYLCSFYYMLRTLFNGGALLFTAMWAIERLPAPAASAAPEKAAAPANGARSISLATHVLLLLFTFGIWFLIWVYRVTGDTNAVKEEEARNPTTKLLLCLFVPFYQIYWTYKTAQRTDRMAAAKGIPSDLSTLCLILSIFVPILQLDLIQDRLSLHQGR